MTDLNVSTSPTDPDSEPDGGGRRARGLVAFAQARPLVLISGVVLLGIVVVSGWSATTVLRAGAVSVTWSIPDAPRLTAGPGQTVHRIDPSRSSVSYEVEENVAGRQATAVGITRGIAGDVLVDDGTPANSQVGELVVNVEQLTSDQSLRDERIRADYLESNRHPLARVRTTAVRGLPERVEDGVDHRVDLAAELTVKNRTKPVEIEATVRRDGGELHIKGSTRLKLSDFDAGPITMIGLVSTGDEAVLRFDLVAPEADDLRVSSAAAQPAQIRTAGEGDPRFSQSVMPVLERRCASCHQPGAAGSGAWELADAGDAARVAGGIGLAVETRYMPPWLASDKGVPLNHSPLLGDDEIKGVLDWARAGGPLDVDPSTRLTAPAGATVTIRSDRELQTPPYTGSPSKENDYRCFVLDPQLTEPKAMTGYAFVPDQQQIVHHGLVYRVAAGGRPALDAAEARDAAPGWECYGSINARARNDLVMGWAPGQPATRLPDGSGIHLQAGDVFVMQVHYHITAENPPADRTGFTFEIGEGDISRYDNVRPLNYLAPAEIPCNPGATAPRCDRAIELQEVARKYGPEGPGIANGLHMQCRTSVAQLAKLEGGIARSSCDLAARAEGQVVGVHGHMHEIGKTFRMTLNPGTPQEKILLDIPRWDFDWQLNYQPREDIEIKRGDTIRVECSWDRALVRPDEEEHYITWSEGTDDEMCYSVLSTRDRKASG